MKRYLPLGLIVLAYILGTAYYHTHFFPNTYFGDLPVSHQALEGAQNSLNQTLQTQEVVLTEAGQNEKTLALTNLNPHLEDTQGLKDTLSKQNAFLWPIAFFGEQVVPDAQIDIDPEALSQWVEREYPAEDRTPATNANINQTTWDITPAEDGNQVDADQLKTLLEKRPGGKTLDVALAYTTPEINEDDSDLQALHTRLQETLNTKISYTLGGDTVTFDRDTIQDWLALDKNNQLYYDADAIEQSLEALNDQYATFGVERTLPTTNQGDQVIPAGTMGWAIDVETETKAIVDDLNHHRVTHRSPAFTSFGSVPGQTGIAELGDTYIEIDLTAQEMYLYEQGELTLSTPIVSGQPGAETVPGMGVVSEMLQDTNLVGYNPFYDVNYSTPVSYWIRFDDLDQGIHDAPWQGSYGGDVWTYAGSLGCINTPYDAVAAIYDTVTIGTPVMVHF